MVITLRQHAHMYCQQGHAMNIACSTKCDNVATAGCQTKDNSLVTKDNSLVVLCKGYFRFRGKRRMRATAATTVHAAAMAPVPYDTGANMGSTLRMPQ